MLTQDIAKKYLATSSPSEKYKFVMQGSHLQELHDDYSQISVQILMMKAKLETASYKMQVLIQDQAKVQAQIDALKAARRLVFTQEELKKKIAWAHVYQQEDERNRCSSRLVAASEALQTYEMECEQEKIRSSVLDSRITGLERSIALIAGEVLSPLRVTESQLESQIGIVNSYILNIDSDERSVVQSRDQVKSNLNALIERSLSSDMTSTINEDMKKVCGDLDEKQRNLDRILAEIVELERVLEEKEKTIENYRRTEFQLRTQLSQTSSSIASLESRMKTLHPGNVNDHKKYGEGVSELLQCLEKSHSKLGFENGGPIGPIGMYVALKDPDTWGQAMEALIGRYMGSFVVTSYHDRDVLFGLMKRFKCINQIVMIPSLGGSVRDYSECTDILTAHKALSVRDARIDSAICILTGIHRVLLCMDRIGAIEQLKNRKGFDYAFLPNGSKVNIGDTGQTFFSFGSGKPSRYFDNVTVQMEALKSELERRNRTCGEIQTQLSHISGICENLSKECEDVRLDKYSDLVVSKQIVVRQMGELRLRVSEIETVSSTPYLKTDDLEEEKRSCERRLLIIDAQLTEFRKKKDEFEEKIRALLDQKRRIREDISRSELEASELKSEHSKLFNEYRSLTTLLSTKCDKRIVLEKNCEECREILEGSEKLLEESKRKALEYCDDECFDRASLEGKTLDDLLRQIRLIEKELVGNSTLACDASLLLSDLEEKSAQKDSLSCEISVFESVVAKLEKSIGIRLARWEEYRKLVCVRSDVHFKWFSSQRGFYGRLVFDHGSQRLFIHATKREQDLPSCDTDGQDLRGLSGGEKSVVTCCLLLSLWECMDSPVRCLDEFDVFMDSVNRKIIMRMLVEYASKASAVHPFNQYFFITPQALSFTSTDLAAISDSTDIKIIRLSDPARTNKQ